MIRRFPTFEALSQAAADAFVDRARAAVAARDACTVALTGGTTARRCYERLAALAERGSVTWNRVQFFWGDERAVGPDDEQSNFRMAREALLAPLAIASSQIHRMEGERPDLDEAARAYQRRLADVFDVPVDGPPPAFDVLLLGMGADGHVASLFPHTAALHETGRWVLAHHVPALDADRMTLTVPVLVAARSTIVLVSGSRKAEALAAVLEGPSNPDRFPAQLLERTPGSVVWFVDEAAAAGLKR
jgi:6-phosphogluconolactonase